MWPTTVSAVRFRASVGKAFELSTVPHEGLPNYVAAIFVGVVILRPPLQGYLAARVVTTKKDLGPFLVTDTIIKHQKWRCVACRRALACFASPPLPSPPRRARANAHDSCTHGIPDPHRRALRERRRCPHCMRAHTSPWQQVARARYCTRLASACTCPPHGLCTRF